jgi:hypothetical protein
VPARNAIEGGWTVSKDLRALADEISNARIAVTPTLILAKLDWSKGVSELQLRDCRNLIALNRDRIEWPYVERWAAALGVVGTLEQVRRAG